MGDIYVSKKVMIQMIIASVIINILFLLLGMVIGKDDNQWQEPTGANSTEQISSSIQTIDSEDPIEMEMTIFERDRESRRSDPIDVDYLEDKQTSKPDEKPKEPLVVETKKTPVPVQNNSPQQRVSNPVGSAQGGYYIQVVASKDRDKVESMRDQLARSGYRVFITQQDNWVKLLVGYFPDSNAANVQKKEIDRELKKAKVNSWVRKR